MGLLRRILGPRNSLLLLHDHITDEGREELEAQIEQIRRFYRFVKLSEILGKDGGENAVGMAALVFRNARKSLFLRATPRLRAEEIPFTLFLRPDCIGLNRLPPEEELAVYAGQFPERFPGATLSEWQARAWNAPAEAEAFLLGLRREVGPLPLNEMDPTLFFATWGKIVEVPLTLMEVGLHLVSDPAKSGDVARDSLTFIRQQTGVQVRIAFSPRASQDDKRYLQPLGIDGLVVPRPGAVEPRTDPMNLPIWPMDREEETKNDQSENEPKS